jgi:hypothetical protein
MQKRKKQPSENEAGGAKRKFKYEQFKKLLHNPHNLRIAF